MSLNTVVEGDPHVQAHNDEREAINSLKDLSDLEFLEALSAFYVRSFSISASLGDGITDATADFQTQINAAEAVGGGTVFIPKGIYVVSTLSLPSRVRLIGQGVGVTVIKKKASTAGPVIQTKDFATLAVLVPDTGTPHINAPFQFGIEQLSVDGNRTNCPTGTFGLAICGYEYRIEDVQIHNAKLDGLYTEWFGSSQDSSDSQIDFIESFLVRVKSFNCGRNGLWHNGPHDSNISECISGNNAKDGSGDGFLIEGNASHFLHCHAFGAHDWAFHTRGQCLLTQPIAEGGKIGQLWVEFHKTQIIGGASYWSGAVGAVGLRLGKTGIAACQDVVIDAHAIQQGSSPRALSPAVEFQNVGRNLHLSVTVGSTDAGIAYSGTIPADAFVNLNVAGGTTGPKWQNPAAVGAWTALSLTGFSPRGGSYDTPSFRVAGDRIEFKGEMVASGAYVGGTVFATMPIGARPAKNRRIDCKTQTGANNLFYDNSNNGLSLFAGVTDTHWVSLDGKFFTLT